MKRLVIAALLLATCAPACKTGNGTDPDADAQDEADDTGAEEPTDARDPTFEPHCCPLDSPSCDCPHVGGTPDDRGECATVCNVRPEDWVRMIDDDGCFFWRIPEDAGSCSESSEEEPEPGEEPEPDEEPEPADEAEPGPEPPPDADAD